jgi:hypothetical protein
MQLEGIIIGNKHVLASNVMEPMLVWDIGIDDPQQAVFGGACTW